MLYGLFLIMFCIRGWSRGGVNPAPVMSECGVGGVVWSCTICYYSHRNAYSWCSLTWNTTRQIYIWQRGCWDTNGGPEELLAAVLWLTAFPTQSRKFVLKFLWRNENRNKWDSTMKELLYKMNVDSSSKHLMRNARVHIKISDCLFQTVLVSKLHNQISKTSKIKYL